MLLDMPLCLSVNLFPSSLPPSDIWLSYRSRPNCSLSLSLSLSLCNYHQNSICFFKHSILSCIFLLACLALSTMSRGAVPSPHLLCAPKDIKDIEIILESGPGVLD